MSTYTVTYWPIGDTNPTIQTVTAASYSTDNAYVNFVDASDVKTLSIPLSLAPIVQLVG